MQWLVDTSAWSRRDLPEVKAQLRRVLDEDEDAELVLSPPVLLELLRAPQGDGVAAAYDMLVRTVAILPVTDQTFDLAAQAMVDLAMSAPFAHRLPVSDLITAALAHQHRCGVVHVDGDFERLAQDSSLSFVQRRLDLRCAGVQRHPMASRQRALRRELAQLLHQKPVAEAERILERVVREVRAA